MIDRREQHFLIDSRVPSHAAERLIKTPEMSISYRAPEDSVS